LNSKRALSFLNSASQALGFGYQPQTLCAFVHSGTANSCFVVASDLGKLLVRGKVTGGLHQQGSWQLDLQCTQYMSESGLGAPLLFADPTHRAMLLKWAGEPKTKTPLTDADVNHLGRRLKQLHNTRPASVGLAQPYHYQQDLRSYLQLAGQQPELSARAIKTLVEVTMPAARQLDQEVAQRPVLCHHDLNIANLVWRNGMPVFIDWEYCRIAAASFDLASLVQWFALDAQQQQTLLQAYQGSTLDLRNALQVVQGLDKLWQMLENNGSTTLIKEIL
jgi:tRNA A-37 threonylcarbamoyl transferase component Bud32